MQHRYQQISKSLEEEIAPITSSNYTEDIKAKEDSNGKQQKRSHVSKFIPWWKSHKDDDCDDTHPELTETTFNAIENDSVNNITQLLPIELHDACATSDSLDNISVVLKENMRYCKLQDRGGKLPLHHISENKRIFQKVTLASPEGCFNPVVEAFVLEEVLPLYPEAATRKDNTGHIPFTQVIFDWILDIHQVRKEPSKTKLGLELVDNEAPDTNDTDIDAMETMIPCIIIFDPMVEWSLMILQAIVDKVSDPQAQAIVEHLARIPCFVKSLLLIRETERRKNVLAASLVQQVLLCKASAGRWLVPMLARKSSYQVQESAIDYMHLISLIDSKELKRKRETARNSYLRRLPSSFRLVERDSKSDVFEELSKQDGIILAVLQLPPKLFDEVADLEVLHWILDEKVLSPGCLSLYVVFLDIQFFVILMTSFRINTNAYFRANGWENVYESIGYDADSVLYFIVSVSGAYFLLRQFNAFKSIPFEVLTSTFGLWFLIDVVSVILALVVEAFYLLDKYRNGEVLRWFAAVATGLLWLKALSFLKVFNRYLATFVMALVEISRDIAWFLLILGITVVAFSQMFYTVLFKPTGKDCMASCSEEINGTCSQNSNPFCRNEPKYSYISVYAIILTDFDLEHFYTSFSVVLFVLFTFAVVMIMFNVLIAIISDSYDKSALNSGRLFTQARVLFVAEMMSMEKGMKKVLIVRCFFVFLLAGFLFLYSVLASEGEEIIAIALDASRFSSAGVVSYLLGFSLMWLIGRIFRRQHCVFITFVIVVFATAATYVFIDWPFPEVPIEPVMVGVSVVFIEALGSAWFSSEAMSLKPCFDCFLLFIFRRILTRSGKRSPTLTDGKEEWSGRIRHLETKFAKTVGELKCEIMDSLSLVMISMENTENRITEKILRSKLQESKKSTEKEIEELQKIIRERNLKNNS